MSPAREIRLPDWWPRDAQEAWETFYSIFPADGSILVRELRYMLQRLANCQSAMKDAWEELKNFKEVTPSILVTWTLTTWISASRNQPLGTGSAPTANPLPHELADSADKVASAVRARDPTIRARGGITEATLAELDRVTNFFKEEAESTERLIKMATLSRKARADNAHRVTFINHMCDLLWQRNGRRPYTLVAILANVVFAVPVDRQLDADTVKKCYHSRSPRDKAREH